MTEPNVVELYEDIKNTMDALKEKTKAFHDAVQFKDRNSETAKKHLQEGIILLSEIGVEIFNLRYLSWSIHLTARQMPATNPLHRTTSTMRSEVKDNIYALGGMNSAIQEVTRSLRGFLAY